MEISGDHRILESPVAAGEAAISAVGGALSAAEDVATRMGSACRLSADAGWIEDSFDSLRHLRVNGRAAEGFSAYSGFFETSDGWIRTHGNYPHHRSALLRAVGLPRGARRGDLSASLARGTAVSLAGSVVQAGGVAAPVLSAGEWSQHPAIGHPAPREGRARWVQGGVAQPLSRRRATQGRNACGSWEGPSDEGSPQLPLSGFRVVSFTRVIAGPIAARLLGALGAQIVRVDPRHMPELHDQRLDTDFGVKTRTADLRRSADRASVHRLLTHADGLLVGYRPGSMDRFGLDADALVAAHPHLATAMIRAWDPDGAWARRRGFDSIVQAASGIASRCSEFGRPGALPAQVLDHVTGYRAAGALMRMWADDEVGVREFALTDVAAELLGIADERERNRMFSGETCGAGAPGVGEGRPRVPARGGVEALRSGPEIREVDTADGVLRHVPPPAALNGTRLQYAFPPQRPCPLVD